jgi:hypothetical protein
VKEYIKPSVIDYGDLRELTADCLGGTGGDINFPGGVFGGRGVGTHTSTCDSK